MIYLFGRGATVTVLEREVFNKLGDTSRPFGETICAVS